MPGCICQTGALWGWLSGRRSHGLSMTIAEFVAVDHLTGEHSCAGSSYPCSTEFLLYVEECDRTAEPLR